MGGKPDIMFRNAFLLAFALLCIASVAPAQIKAVEDFISQHDGEIRKFYVYQSSLRMLNQGGDENFNKLIRDIRKINVYVAENAGVSPKSHFRKMITNLSDDAFETLVSVRNDNSLVQLMGKDIKGRSYYVLAAVEEGSFALLEMDGSLDLRYLEALKSMNVGKLKEIVGAGGKEQEGQMEEIQDH